MSVLAWLRNYFRDDDDSGSHASEVQIAIAKHALLIPPLASAQADQLLKALKTKLDAKPESMTSQDVLASHLALIDLLPAADLRRRVHSLRSEYRVLAGPTVFGDYVATAPPTVSAAPSDELQADARYLCRQLFQLYESLPRQENWRNRLIMAGTAISLVVLTLGVWTYIYMTPTDGVHASTPIRVAHATSPKPNTDQPAVLAAAPDNGKPTPAAPGDAPAKAPEQATQKAVSLVEAKPADLNGATAPAGKQLVAAPASSPSAFPMLAVVLLAGAFGGAVSTQQRIQRSSVFDSYPRLNSILMASRKSSISVSPIMGALFASVLYALFLAGIISGALFPVVIVPSNASNPLTSMAFAQFVSESGPRDGIDIAKLMVWSFASGFAERLVPDTLDRLTARFEQSAIRSPTNPA